MRRFAVIASVVVLVIGILAGCSGGKYKDGDYTAESKPDSHGSSAKLTITIKADKIVKADWQEFSNGKLKDETYGMKDGKIDNQENYDKAQNALKTSRTYGEKLVTAQDVNKIDGTTGASNSFKSFKDLVNEALSKAKK